MLWLLKDNIPKRRKQSFGSIFCTYIKLRPSGIIEVGLINISKLITYWAVQGWVRDIYSLN